MWEDARRWRAAPNKQCGGRYNDFDSEIMKMRVLLVGVRMAQEVSGAEGERKIKE